MKKIVFQKHHPSRKLFPNYTIKLRNWHHLFIRRLEQYKPSEENLAILYNIRLAVEWVYMLMHKTLREKGDEDA